MGSTIKCVHVLSTALVGSLQSNANEQDNVCIFIEGKVIQPIFMGQSQDTIFVSDGKVRGLFFGNNNESLVDSVFLSNSAVVRDVVSFGFSDRIDMCNSTTLFLNAGLLNTTSDCVSLEDSTVFAGVITSPTCTVVNSGGLSCAANSTCT
jgi:hypothetical protein